MMRTAGIDVGSSAVKIVVVEHADAGPRVVAARIERLRHRNVAEVAREAWNAVLADANLRADDIAYVATTGEGELIDFRTGHFYGMTAHAKGASFLVPGANAALDAGALHARAIVIDGDGKVQR
ncbi:MAG: benzoyl-CoA reductase subunit D, partial [Planctomycetes bacterium]|nr:benzoyl-CoA reductase subunit D [Planctomycetota bacterium]